MTSMVFAQINIPNSLGATFGLGTQDLYVSLIQVVNSLLGF